MIQRKPDARAAAPMTARELRACMSRAGVDPVELAARLGVTVRSVQHWLDGRRIPYRTAYAVRHL